ncbi:MAG TPA: glycosyltransferase [Bryobacteraceae bacterium]|nr:glycosyltransferase [Bryobacteraceae bacterium]
MPGDRCISVIIAAFNAGETLPGCLTGLRHSLLSPFEIIVVDDGSADCTATVARDFGCTVISNGQRSGPARARNLGAANARGAILVFLDADVIPHADTLGQLISHFADPVIGGVFGAYDDAPSDPGFFSRYRNLLHCHTHRIGRANAATFWAGCGAIRRELFQAFGGFDERYEHASIEDVELGMRLTDAGVRIRLDAEAKAQHLKRWTLLRMSRADVLHRGIPWTRLIFERRRMPNDLNVRWSQRISVGAAWVALGAACSGQMLAAAGAVATVALCNWPFLKFLKQRAGWSFPIRALPVQFLFSFYCGLSFLAGALVHLRHTATGTAPLASIKTTVRL